ncbi:hypothetical protein BP6252_10226 [Coleophoma cylindrospora]|uniref:Heterokaryon incompatibility domain-containing protein n=1 Tax=Coleophoma cylindrospora TaxID=1849047 RepID=A0A3D8QRZ5_9HELO|nr:hypothetical protein BP6252_10226 [Coleophoma cylindrospora]
MSGFSQSQIASVAAEGGLSTEGRDSAALFHEAHGAGARSYSIGSTDFTTERPIYQYTPLILAHSQFRLIRLQHGVNPSPIKCYMQHSDLSVKTLHYSALSYEWGQPTDSDPYILVDKCLMRVRSNLLHALMHIRHPQFGLLVWIDALCINQADNEERSQQVQMMGDIFKGAGTVFVWLGLSDTHSDVAMDAIEDGNFEDGNFEEHHDDILKLCTRPFWYRVWVIQEINLAKNLIFLCGHKTVSGDAFEAFLSGCQKELASSNYGERGPVLHHRTFDWWLSDIIEHNLQCSEPRDILLHEELGSGLPGCSKGVEESAAESLLREPASREDGTAEVEP